MHYQLSPVKINPQLLQFLIRLPVPQIVLSPYREPLTRQLHPGRPPRVTWALMGVVTVCLRRLLQRVSLSQCLGRPQTHKTLEPVSWVLAPLLVWDGAQQRTVGAPVWLHQRQLNLSEYLLRHIVYFFERNPFCASSAHTFCLPALRKCREEKGTNVNSIDFSPGYTHTSKYQHEQP